MADERKGLQGRNDKVVTVHFSLRDDDDVLRAALKREQKKLVHLTPGQHKTLREAAG